VKKCFAVAVAISATGALAFAVPANAADTYYYAAGTRGSGMPSQTSVDEWKAFLGQNHVPPAYTVQYPRDLAPLIGEKPLDKSVREGVDAARQLIAKNGGPDGVTLVGVSQGAVVMYRTKQSLIKDPVNGIDPSAITVVTFGDPVNPDGGFLSKLDRYNINIPGYTPATHTPGEGAYVTFAIEYDLIADSPDNLNPVSWANAALGAAYDHPSYSLNMIEDAAAEGRVVSNAEEWYESPGDTQAVAYYQHNLIKQKNLPLTRPLRDIATAVADDQGDVVVNRTVDQLDNLLRPVVDAGYDGGEPGGTRHVGTTTKHYENAEADSTAKAVSVKTPEPKRPLRDAIKKVGDAVEKFSRRLAPKADD
jgi:hypothetical protein